MSKYVKGIDVAHWEPVVDWARVRAQEIRFAFIKATQADFADSMFASHWAGAKRAGILRGAYHFIDPRVDGRRQAEAFLRTVKLEPGDLPPVLDLEDLAEESDVNEPAGKRSAKRKGETGRKGSDKNKGKNGGKGGAKSRISTSQVAPADVVACVEVWLDIVERETGRKPILYSSPSYLESRMRGRNNQTPHWASDYVIWIANYLNHEVTENDLPLQPNGWPDWKFWQYSDDSFLDGIFNKESTQLTEVDMNFFRGTLDELYALAGATASEPDVKDPSVVEPPDKGVPEPIPQPIPQPIPEPKPQPVASFISYFVQSGDNLTTIAAKHGTTVEAILRLNPQITNPNFIRIGDSLKIPQSPVA